MLNDTVAEPKGIGFFNIKSGDTHYARLEPTIQAYINSSDMGINASRDQDFGCRLDPEWVKRVKAFRRDRMQMQILTSGNNGQKPSTVQILYYLYGEEVRAYEEEIEEHENPFEEEYLQKISSNPQAASTSSADLEPDEELPFDVAEDDLETAPVEEEEVDTDAVAEAATSEPTPTTGITPSRPRRSRN